MLVIGANLADFNIFRDLADPKAWLGVIFRNFLLPLVTILLLLRLSIPQDANLTMLVT